MFDFLRSTGCYRIMSWKTVFIKSAKCQNCDKNSIKIFWNILFSGGGGRGRFTKKIRLHLSNSFGQFMSTFWSLISEKMTFWVRGTTTSFYLINTITKKLKFWVNLVDLSIKKSVGLEKNSWTQTQSET